MNASRSFLLTSFVLLAASVAAANEETGIIFKEPLEPVLGEPEKCVSSRQVRNIEVLSDKLLILKGTHNRYWINQLPKKCVGLDDKMVIKVELFGNQICRNDRFEASEPFNIAPFVAQCRWGMFEPAALEQVAMIKSELKKS